MLYHQTNSFYEIDTKREADREWEWGGSLWDPKGGHCGETLQEAGALCGPGTLAAWAVRWPWISVLEPFSGLWAGLTPLMKHKEQTCLTPSYFVMTWTHVNIKVQILNCGSDIWCLCKVWKISISREKLRNHWETEKLSLISLRIQKSLLRNTSARSISSWVHRLII